MYISTYPIQWNLLIKDTLGPAIFERLSSFRGVLVLGGREGGRERGRGWEGVTEGGKRACYGKLGPQKMSFTGR